MTLNQIFDINRKIELKCNGLRFGDVLLQNIQYGQKSTLSGIFVSEAVLGDKSVPVSKIIFNIPNLKSFLGSPAKSLSPKHGLKCSNNRLFFENELYEITIDKIANFKELYEKLTIQGGG